MGFFSKILGGNDSQTIVRCDEAEFLIWKYQGGAVKSGTSIIVKDGEVAALIGSTQTTIEGPANTTASEDLSEVFFINLAGSNVVRFAVPYFGVNDPRYPDLNVPVAVRGSINFNIEDYKGFIRMHRLVGFDMEAFQKKIKDAVIKYVKSVVSNIPTDHSIPVVQMEKKILEIGEILNQYLKQRLAIDFAINVRAVDLNAIEYDADDESYKQLRALTQGQAAEMSQTQHKINMDQMKAQSQLNIDAMRETQKQDLYNRGANLDMDRQMRAQDIKDRGEKMRIQRDLGEKAYNAQIDEMQKSGRMAMGGMPNMGQPVGGFNPSGINGIGGPKPAAQVPPQIPQVSIYVAIGGQTQGPFDYNMLKEMVRTGGLTAQTLVWKEGINWTPAIQVPEVASILNAPQTPPPPTSAVPPTPPTPPGVPPTL